MGLFGRNNDSTAAAGAPDPAALSGTYTLDPVHTTLGFIARHAMVTNVRGAFHEFQGTLHLDGANPAASTATLDIKVNTIDTGVDDRDNHLRSADFFDVENFPEMTFRSTNAESLGGNDYRITGDLTIKDITKPISIDLEYNGHAKDPMGNERVGFSGTAKIMRSEWGLSWNAALETGGWLVSDEIKLELDISAIKSDA